MQSNTLEISDLQTMGTKKEPIDNRKKYFFLMMIFWIMFIVRHLLEITFPVFFYLVWILFMVTQFSEEEIVSMIISFIPFTPGFQYKYAIAISIIALFFKSRRTKAKVRLNAILIYGVFIILWEFLHIWIGDFSLGESIRGFAELLFIIVFFTIIAGQKRIDSIFVIRSLAISTAIACFIVLMNTMNARDKSLLSLIEEGLRFGTADTTMASYSMNFNANGLGSICNTALSGLLIVFSERESRAWEYPLFGFIAVIGALTVSRTYLICLFVSVVFLIFSSPGSKGKKSTVLISFVIAIACLLAVVNEFFPDIIKNYVSRMNADDITNGRLVLLEDYNDLLDISSLSLFFGLGMQNLAVKASEILGRTVIVPHNGLQQIIVSWGIVGLFLFICFFISVLLIAKKNNPKTTLIRWLPCFLWLLSSFGGQIITSEIKMLSIVFIYIAVADHKVVLDVGKELSLYAVKSK